jgi:cell division protein FtsI (penicillin-binding protein 3)
MAVSALDILPPPARRVKLGNRTAEALELGRGRLLMCAVVFALAFSAVAVRLADLAVLHLGGAPGDGRAVASAVPERADIVDRNGTLLATSLATSSLYADAALVDDPDAAVARLQSVLPELDAERASALLATDRRFVWLHRHITPREQYLINRLGIPGIGFQDESRRFYPFGHLTAHVVGFTDLDGRGLAGIELSQNDRLADGLAPVRLSLDVRLQAILHEELTEAIDEFRAEGGAGLILDAETGEVVAMVSLPDFNPYEAGSMPDEMRFNRNTLGVYEMGSTFKIFTAAMALDSGVTSLTGGYDATHPIRIGRYTITDYHAEARWLTVPEIFRYSSNIGAVHMAMDVGRERQRDYLRRLGLMTRSPIELQEVGWPIIPDPWRESNTMTVSFGHGLAVSPIQLASGVAAVVNGGVLHPATLLARDADEAAAAGRRVIAPQTSEQMRRLLRLVVEEGTGRQADAEGYLVGGKTGTAEKSSGGGYARNALLSSFVAAFPMTRPDYVILAMLDEPQGNESTYGYATGGWVAAPVVRRVVERMAPMLGLSPIDHDDPAVREAMRLPLPPAESRVASYSTQ